MLELPPKIDPLIREFFDQADALPKLIAQFGSPLNILFPQIVGANIHAHHKTISDRDVRFRLYYAHKANQSSAIAKQCAKEKIFIDVASQGELKSALANGFPGDCIQVTGPKSNALLALAIEHGTVINVDNVLELKTIAELAKQIRKGKQDILVRFTNFPVAPTKKPRLSRFGIPVERASEVLDYCKRHKDAIRFIGPAFHFDSHNPEEKITAIDHCFKIIEEASAIGLEPKALDIGGGFRQVFMDDEKALVRYVDALKESLVSGKSNLAWLETSFGYHVENGRVTGTPVFERYRNTIPGHEAIAEILDTKTPSDPRRTVAQLFTDTGIELYVEPGKSLVDHSGITVASVILSKQLANGETLIALDIKRDNLVAGGQEMMTDPVLVRQGPDSRKRTENGIFIAGPLCIEQDLIYMHKVFLEQIPISRDLLVFINTAGYQMDFSASEALMHPVPRKITIAKKEKKFVAVADEDYMPN